LSEAHFILVKLISGEQVMAILEQETGTDIDIVFPMLIRLFPQFDDTGSREHVTATPFSHFADDTHLTINKSSIIFVKNLNPAMIPHYLRLVAQENDKTGLNLNQDLTSNKDSLAKLRKLVNATASQEDTEEHVIERISLILGNDTIH